jgi:hypothetical protein
MTEKMKNHLIAKVFKMSKMDLIDYLSQPPERWEQEQLLLYRKERIEKIKKGL